MARFVSIPALPVEDVPDWELRTLSALKTNIELLTAILNKTDPARQALLKRTYTLPSTPLPTITSVAYPTVGAVPNAVAAVNDGGTVNVLCMEYNTNWGSVPSTINTLGTISDLEALRVDIANIRATVEAIIAQFKTL